MPVVRPAAVASMTTAPTSWPVIVLVATPATAVAVPVPVTVPAPDCLPKVTTVVLSEVTVLPAASWIVAVSTRVAPEVRLVTAPVSEICVAAPWTTVKEPSVPVVRPAAVASMTTAPTSWPVIVLVATPATAVAVPVPVTVPAPDCLAKLTTVVLSEVTVLPAASRIVAVSTRVAPEVRLVTAPVSEICVAAPWTTVKEPSVPVVRPPAVASMTTAPTRTPVIVLVATPLAAVAVPVPLTVPAPDCLPKVTTVVLSEVTVLPAASWIVAVSTRVAPEVRLVTAPVSEICVAAPWTTVKEPSVPVVRPPAVASITTAPTSTPVIVFVATPFVTVAVPVPLTVPAPDCFENVITVEELVTAMFPLASLIVAVSTRVAPEVRLVTAPVSPICVAAPCTRTSVVRLTVLPTLSRPVRTKR